MCRVMPSLQMRLSLLKLLALRRTMATLLLMASK
jgi:hypothetical protein